MRTSRVTTWPSRSLRPCSPRRACWQAPTVAADGRDPRRRAAVLGPQRHPCRHRRRPDHRAGSAGPRMGGRPRAPGAAAGTRPGLLLAHALGTAGNDPDDAADADALDLADLAAACPVVMVVVSGYRSDALVLTAEGLSAVQLPALTPAAVREMAADLIRSRGRAWRRPGRVGGAARDAGPPVGCTGRTRAAPPRDRRSTPARTTLPDAVVVPDRPVDVAAAHRGRAARRAWLADGARPDLQLRDAHPARPAARPPGARGHPIRAHAHRHPGPGRRSAPPRRGRGMADCRGAVRRGRCGDRPRRCRGRRGRRRGGPAPAPQAAHRLPRDGGRGESVAERVPARRGAWPLADRWCAGRAPAARRRARVPVGLRDRSHGPRTWATRRCTSRRRCMWPGSGTSWPPSGRFRTILRCGASAASTNACARRPPIRRPPPAPPSSDCGRATRRIRSPGQLRPHRAVSGGGPPGSAS